MTNYYNWLTKFRGKTPTKTWKNGHLLIGYIKIVWKRCLLRSSLFRKLMSVSVIIFRNIIASDNAKAIKYSVRLFTTIRCLHMTTFRPSGSIYIWYMLTTRRSTLNLVWYVPCSTKTLLEAWFSMGSSQARKVGPKKWCMTRITLLYYRIKKNAGRLL